MPGAVALVLTSDEAECGRAGAVLFPGADRRALQRAALRPRAPFAGPLFGLLGERPRGDCVGLVVSAVLIGSTGAGRDARADPPSSASRPAPAGPSPGDAVAIADHVNLELRGPLSGVWPAAVPRDFPNMTGIYQPGDVRARGEPRVYSSGVVAAGVADARRLTDFEVRAVREGGLHVVSDSLIPAAIIAAYYGLRLAACGILRAPERNRE